ncbi:MAG: hypothetical protein MJA83_16565 [Gammaproteobacteria bacterium]|nr:hypothetical protein [Gammaproteobacteria bacterium]
MPPPALKSLASKAGKSLDTAERYYDAAKKQRMKDTGKSDKKLTDRDYEYIMGVTKKRLGLPTKKAESYIEMALRSAYASSLIESVTENSSEKVRAFYDSGELCFCTLEDVMVQPGTDHRLDAVATLVNEFQWPADFPLLHEIDGFEGTADEVLDKAAEHVSLVKEVAKAAKPRGPRKETLAQKQGARQGGRTRMRHAEGFGAIYHEYYDRQGDDAKKFLDAISDKVDSAGARTVQNSSNFDPTN